MPADAAGICQTSTPGPRAVSVLRRPFDEGNVVPFRLDFRKKNSLPCGSVTCRSTSATSSQPTLTRRKVAPRSIWQAARPAPDDHEYLIAKGVKAHGLRVLDGTLVVPMRDETHEVKNIAMPVRAR